MCEPHEILLRASDIKPSGEYIIYNAKGEYSFNISMLLYFLIRIFYICLSFFWHKNTEEKNNYNFKQKAKSKPTS